MNQENNRTETDLAQLFQKRLMALMRWHLSLWLPLSILALGASLYGLRNPQTALLVPAILLLVGIFLQRAMTRWGWKRWWALAALGAGDPPAPTEWKRADRVEMSQRLRTGRKTVLEPAGLIWIRIGGLAVLILIFAGAGLSMLFLLKRPLLALVPIGVASVFAVALLWASLLEGVLWFFLHWPSRKA